MNDYYQDHICDDDCLKTFMGEPWLCEHCEDCLDYYGQCCVCGNLPVFKLYKGLVSHGTN